MEKAHNPTESGIYSIKHSDGCVYVGSAVKIVKRFSEHLHDLTRGVHVNPKLQAAWNKYGEDAFTFSVIEYVEDKSLLLVREQYWIDRHVENMYNICLVAGSHLGVKRTDESRSKMSAAQKGRTISASHREKISAVHKGKTMSPESRLKMSVSRKGLVRSDKHRANLSAVNKGKVLTPEHRAKLAESHRGKTLTPEHRAKIAEAMKNRIFSPEHKAKLSAALVGNSRRRAALSS